MPDITTDFAIEGIRQANRIIAEVAKLMDKVTSHDEAEKTCFNCANGFVDDDDLIICVLDGRTRDDDQTCDEWN